MKLHVWFLGTLVCGSIVTAQQAPSRQVEWLYYGGDQAGHNSHRLPTSTSRTCRV